jgi:hypothetical protein
VQGLGLCEPTTDDESAKFSAKSVQQDDNIGILINIMSVKSEWHTVAAIFN